MGFFDNVKKGARSYADNYKKTSAENKAYRNDVNEAVKKARRETYKKEAVVQARLKGKILAKQKFNPSPQRSSMNGMTSDARALIYGSGGFSNPKPQQSPVRRAVQRQGKKKGKKGKKTIKRQVQHIQKQIDPMHDLLYNS
jgi:hypothetical protein